MKITEGSHRTWWIIAGLNSPCGTDASQKGKKKLPGGGGGTASISGIGEEKGKDRELQAPFPKISGVLDL